MSDLLPGRVPSLARVFGTAPGTSSERVVAEGREIVWRDTYVHDCPLCGTEVRRARQRNNTAVLLDPAGDLHPVICDHPPGP